MRLASDVLLLLYEESSWRNCQGQADCLEGHELNHLVVKTLRLVPHISQQMLMTDSGFGRYRARLCVVLKWVKHTHIIVVVDRAYGLNEGRKVADCTFHLIVQ